MIIDTYDKSLGLTRGCHCMLLGTAPGSLKIARGSCQIPLNQGQLSKTNYPWLLPAYFEACLLLPFDSNHRVYWHPDMVVRSTFRSSCPCERRVSQSTSDLQPDLGAHMPAYGHPVNPMV